MTRYTRFVMARAVYTIFATATLSTVALVTTVSSAADGPKVDPDGTIQVPAFELPGSSLLSEETRAALKKVRDQQNRSADVIGKCPAETPDRAAMARVRE